jgi:hypothetical protein
MRSMDVSIHPILPADLELWGKLITEISIRNLLAE